MQIKDVQFDDLYSIDADSLKSSSPLYGVIFLFKYGQVDRDYAADNNKPLDGTYDEDYQQKGIFFANQTIQNACATQAVLNVLLNKPEIEIGEELTNFKGFVEGFDSEICGETISNSELIRSVHNSFSSPSLLVDEDKQNPKPKYDDKNDGLFHFVGYLNINDQIYELDGLKTYPIKHGECKSNEEFCQKLPEILMRRISQYGDELRFSLLAISNDKLRHYQEIGDGAMMHSEMMKRETWKRENELRRHDFVGLMVELLKNIGKDLSDDEYEDIIKQARHKGQLKLLQNFTKNHVANN